MLVYILLEKVRTLLEWADEPLSKMFGKLVSGVEFMTTRALYGANKRVTNPMISLIYSTNNIHTLQIQLLPLFQIKGPFCDIGSVC